MSNTVTNISYANTFGDWMVATNALINENNVLAAGDYTKSSGTIYLNETTQNSLQANGTVVIQKELRVQGTGSAATIDRNLSVGGQVLFSNTSLSVTTSGQANLNGLVLVQGPDIGISVSNNAYVGGNTTIRYNTITNNVQSNVSVNTQTLSVTTNSYSDNLIANTQVQTSILSVSGQSYLTGDVYTYNDVNVGDNLIVSTGATVAGVNVIPFVTASFVKANAAYDSQNTTGSYANSAFLKANSAYGSQNTTGTYANSAFEFANSAGSYANSAFLKANSAYGSQNTTGTYANSAFEFANSAGSYANSAFLKANAAYAQANSASLYANGAFVQANASYDSQNTTGTYANSAFLKANSAYGSQNTTGTYANSAYAQANSASLYANGAFVQSNSAYAQANSASLYANGAFVQANAAYGSQNTTGSYANSAFTFANSAGSYANSAFLKANAAYGSQNTTGTYANSAFEFANSAGSYANSAFLKANSAYAQANGASLYANGAFIQANSVYTLANNILSGAQSVATLTVTGSTLTALSAAASFKSVSIDDGLSVGGNFTINGTTVYNSPTLVLSSDTPNQIIYIGSFRTANGVANGVASNAYIRYNETNNNWEINDVLNTDTATSYSRLLSANSISDDSTSTSTSTTPTSRLVTGSYTQANAAFIQANAAFLVANTPPAIANSAALYANGAFLQANAAFIKANTPPPVANSGAAYANAAFIQANAAFLVANTPTHVANSAALYANGAFVQANAAFLVANTPTHVANSAALYANGAFIQANAAFLQSNGAFIQANAAYGSQNTTGTYANASFLQANGSFTQANAAFLKANAAYTLANTFANTFVGTTGSISQSSGVISFSSNNGVRVVATSSNNFAISTSQDLQTANTPTFAGLVLTTQLGTAYGGTGATSPQGALNNLLPTGTTAGYVLTTGGPNNFYWAAGGGGGSGATPGTTINSTRLSYTANGQSGYTGNSFIIPTATTSTQVRAYINGVRQFESEYTANLSSNTIAFSTTPTNGDAVLIEVDGYYVNPYYANNITYGPATGDIPTSANTIQLAIDSLESRKAAVAGATFTGIASGITVATGVSNTAFATTAHVQNSIAPAFTQANTAGTNAATADSKAVTAGSYANSAFLQANGAFTQSNASFSQANAAFTKANNAFANTTGTFNGTLSVTGTISSLQSSGDEGGQIDLAKAATNSTLVTGVSIDVYQNRLRIFETGGTTRGVYIDLANNAGTTIGTDLLSFTSAASYANGAFRQANGAFTAANTADSKAVSAGSYANAAFSVANNSIQTNGNTQFYSIGVGTTASQVNGEIVATGTITAGYSDDNLKTKLGTIENALDKVMSLNGFYYEPNQTAQDLGYVMKREVGISAQEVEKVLPEVVVPAPIDNKYLTIQYEKMVPLLIEAIKELKLEIDALKGNKQ